MGIKYFSEFNIKAGFTTKPCEAISCREALIGSCDLVVRPKLVHGTDICIIDEAAVKTGPYIEIDDCDGLVTNIKNVMLTSTHGDCIPVYAYDPVKKVIGLAHAGWRGTADCIVNNLIYCMCEEYHCKAKNIKAVIGPGIGACCFEVDSDVAEYFTEAMPWTEEYMCEKHLPGYSSDSMAKKYLIDLKGINCELLEVEGVKAENIYIDFDCTCCESNKEKFWSFRRDKTDKRMLAYIMIKGDTIV